MDSLPVLSFLIAGQLRRDYIITSSGKVFLDVPGGNLLYSAAGLGVWERDAGLIGRAGADYPVEWLDKAAQFGFDRRGVRLLPDPLDLRNFIAYADPDIRLTENPVLQFAQRGLPFPKSLLGFAHPPPRLDSKTQPVVTTIRLKDMPQDYFDATAAHVCPLDFLSQTLLPSSLRQGHISTITLDPAPSYMNPVFWDEIPAVLHGLTAFITNEKKLLDLFQGRSTDLWEMAETLGNLGCEIIVIKRGRAANICIRTPIIPAGWSRLIQAIVLTPPGQAMLFAAVFWPVIAKRTIPWKPVYMEIFPLPWLSKGAAHSLCWMRCPAWPTPAWKLFAICPIGLNVNLRLPRVGIHPWQPQIHNSR